VGVIDRYIPCMSDRPSNTNVIHIAAMIAVLIVSLAVGISVANGRLSLTAASMASAPSQAASDGQNDHQDGDRKDKDGKDKDRKGDGGKHKDRKDTDDQQNERDDDQSNRSEDRQGEKAEVTVTGTVGTGTAANGATMYTLDTGTTVLRLNAGPAWFYPDAHPLAPYVGQQVTVVGEQRQGTRQVDVLSIDGTVIREPGRPPWAGGKQKQDRSAASPGPNAASPSPNAAAPSPSTTPPSPSTTP
jgi:hypothetical protein